MSDGSDGLYQLTFDVIITHRGPLLFVSVTTLLLLEQFLLLLFKIQESELFLDVRVLLEELLGQGGGVRDVGVLRLGPGVRVVNRHLRRRVESLEGTIGGHLVGAKQGLAEVSPGLVVHVDNCKGGGDMVRNIAILESRNPSQAYFWLNTFIFFL